MKKIFTILLIFGYAFSVYAWGAGDRVLSKWTDGYWYPAKIVAVNGTKFKIAFDDGDAIENPASAIKKLDWKVGTKVSCNFQNTGSYYTGKIDKMSGESIHIQYDDGDQEDSSVSKCRSK